MTAPLTDAQVRAVGWEPTRGGWMPTRGQQIPDGPELLPEILDARSPNVPEPIAEVEALRAGARRIVESDDDYTSKAGAIRALLHTAARAQLPEWGKEAVLAEWYTYAVPSRPDVPPPDRERDWRRLREAGYASCPVCHAELPSEIEFTRWRNRRRWAAEDEKAHREAAS